MLEARFGDDPLTTWDIRYFAKNYMLQLAETMFKLTVKLSNKYV